MVNKYLPSKRAAVALGYSPEKKSTRNQIVIGKRFDLAGKQQDPAADRHRPGRQQAARQANASEPDPSPPEVQDATTGQRQGERAAGACARQPRPESVCKELEVGMGLRRLTEEELTRLSKRRPATVAFLRQHRAEAAQRAKQEAATLDAIEGVVCGGIEEGYRNAAGEVIRESRFSAPTQQPSQQAASRSTDTEPST